MDDGVVGDAPKGICQIKKRNMTCLLGSSCGVYYFWQDSDVLCTATYAWEKCLLGFNINQFVDFHIIGDAFGKYKVIALSKTIA